MIPPRDIPSRLTQTTQVQNARRILGGASAPVDEIRALADALIEQRRFSYARRLLAKLRERSFEETTLRLTLAQRQAYCTYMDTDLPAAERFDRALAILEVRCNLATTKDPQTLALAGAALERRWELGAQKEDLERALAYYLRGYEQGPENDLGHTGNSAAFLLDQLAKVEAAEAAHAGMPSDSAAARREEASAIRQELVETLTAMATDVERTGLRTQWRFLVAIAEAQFGLGEYEGAIAWLQEARGVPVSDWQYRATLYRLGAIARLRDEAQQSPQTFAASQAGLALKELAGEHVGAVPAAYVGKIGLALSGGGFRAALFHIGVLAKLAELDVLRHVEVLSCVSGGSILGAHYYLLLRELLQSKRDADITREDYVELVRRLERQCLAGAQQNLRARALAELSTNLKMILVAGYSRTMRMGELLERFLYRRVNGQTDGKSWWAPWRVSPRWLTDLFVRPLGEDANRFTPRRDNWRRCAKVPELILNATTLNTGHNWQFTASWMGEPPGAIDPEAGGSYRLRRMYYWEAPPRYRWIRLGHAVAASAAAPGLLEPLTLDGIYPRVSVRLADGGMHDNQGITGLMEQDCQVLLVSDGTGQLEVRDPPSRGPLGAPLRASDILMSRVREEQCRQLEARRRSGVIRGLMVLHLRQDLELPVRDWVGCEDPQQPATRSDANRSEPARTIYGIPKEIQRRLAAVRTDLDSFCDAEAFALMTSGYRMAGHAFQSEPALQALTDREETEEGWRFLKVEQVMHDPERAVRLARLLDVAGAGGFRIWRLSPELRKAGIVLALVAAAVVGVLTWTWRDVALLTVGWLGLGLLAAAGGCLLAKRVLGIPDLQGKLARVGSGLLYALIGPLAVRLHLWVFDRWYLERGRIDNL